MEVLQESPQALQKALEVLHAGGIVAHATETCYGLACDLTNKNAVEKLFAIKDRPDDMPVSGLFDALEKTERSVEWNEDALKIAVQHLPGPLTIILPIKEQYQSSLFPTPDDLNKTIGVRISSHPFAHELINAFGSPLSTTSANLHGQPNPYSADDLRSQYGDRSEQPDLIIDSGQLPQNDSSTVIDASGKDIRVLRKGTIDISIA